MRARFLSSIVASLAVAAAPALAQDLGDPSIASDQARKLQDEMRADPAIMQAIEDLRDDPAVQEILRDPSVAEALRKGDIPALLANPKVGELMDHPDVRDITRQLEHEHPEPAR